MIVKEPQLVLVMPSERVWIGDSRLVEGGSLPDDEYFKIKHQLMCSDCGLGVRAEDDHLCSDPD